MQSMDIKSVANRLGHKNCDVTHNIYAAVTNEMKVKNAEKMDEFFAKMATGWHDEKKASRSFLLFFEAKMCYAY